MIPLPASHDVDIQIRRVTHVLEKGSGRINEDDLFVNETMFGVFDGATSLVAPPAECSSTTGGCLAASTACSLFQKNCRPLHLLAADANRAIHDAMTDYGVDCSRREALWSTSAAVVRITSGSLEWVQTGDANTILIYTDGSYRALVNHDDHDYETLTKWKQASSHTKGRIHEVLKEQIRSVRKNMNRSYGVLNGEEEALEFLSAGTEPLDNVTDILLFTDGLSIPTEIPARVKNFDELVRRYKELGLKGLTRYIRSVEQNDPECRRFPRFKCHDDLSAIAISLATPDNTTRHCAAA